MPGYTVAELAERVGGTVEGDPERRIASVAAPDLAGPSDLAFATSRGFLRLLARGRAGAALLPPDLEPERDDLSVIRVADPQRALAPILELLYPEPPASAGVHPAARLGRGVELGDGVSIGAAAVLGEAVRLGAGSRLGPHCVLEDGVEVGRDCRIEAACSLLRGTRVGDRVQLGPGVRLGTEGFGYAGEGEARVKVPQIGGCVIEDDVEIGANSTVDRGTLGDTVVGRGTKIDNLVHIGHNVRVGRNCVIVAQVGIGGSAVVGDDVVLAGQAGVADHVTIGDGARIAARAGVIGDVPAGATWSGFPARPHGEAMRASAALLRLPGALRRLRALEREREGEGAGSGGPT